MPTGVRFVIQPHTTDPTRKARDREEFRDELL